MAVVHATIKAALEALYTQCQQPGGISEADFADSMATIIRDAILSADVTVNNVTLVTPGTGTSGPGTGSLS